MLWSPAPAQALREIVFSAPFLITFLAARQVASKNPRVIVKSLYIFCMMGALHSLLVLMMLFAPFLKTAFFASPVAFLFINQNSLDAISSGAQVTTTFGSDKSPGFFVNPNVAGVWSAVAFAATILVRRYRKSVLLNAAALLDLGAIGASGSKASLGLLVLVPLIAWLVLKILPPVGQRRRVVSTVMYALVLGAAAYGARLALDHASFMENSEHTLLTRSIMWQHAVNQFFITPWLGQGFGGWTLSFAPVGYAYQYLGIQPTFPPHNSLIILWSQSGLAALALGMMIIFYLLRISIAPRQDPDALMLCYCALGAYLFVLIQAMGENYGIVGDIHIKIPLAAILGWASIYEKRTARE